MTRAFLTGPEALRSSAEPASGRRAAAGLLLLAAFLFAGCAGGPEAVAPAVPAAAPAAEPTVPVTFYLPLESATVIERRDDELTSALVELRFDRPGAFSIAPERFLLTADLPLRLTPIQTYGDGGLKRSDIVVLRLATERLPGYRRGAYGEDFFADERAPLALPEALIFVDSAVAGRYYRFRAAEDSRAARTGLLDARDLIEADGKLWERLSESERSLLNEILEFGSAAGSRRGYRSLLVIPREPGSMAAYPLGLDLELTLRPQQLEAGLIHQGVSLAFLPRESDINPTPEVRIGDLGLFTGATPLLDPDLPRVTTELYRSQVLRKIGESRRLVPSPVLWEGSFNAYRDERRRFLFYPGIFSYIPGKHPDLSEADVQRVTGMRAAELDRSLRGRSLVTFRRDIYGAIPAFIAASESPTELEIAFQSNPRLRESLREFLMEPAYFLWLD